MFIFNNRGSSSKRYSVLRRRGFTLIELLVVIFIIGLLASIVVVSVQTARVKARDAKRKADIRSLKTAIELYANDNKQYPGPNDGTFQSMSTLATALTPYLNPIPHDPRGTGGVGTLDYEYVSSDPNNYALLVKWDLCRLPLNVTNCPATIQYVCKTGSNMKSWFWTWEWGTAPSCDF